MCRVIVVLLFVLLFPLAAHAQCTMPNGPDAEMGVIIFNKAHKIMQYCDGDKWIGLWGGRGASGELGKLNDVDLSAPAIGQVLSFDGTSWVNMATLLSEPPACTGADKALQWNGSAWSCATIEGGGATMDLVNGQHSSAQCTALGGEVVTSGTTKMCRINGTVCPAGWAKYQNWSTYSAGTCNEGCLVIGPYPGSCTTATRAWADSTAVPSACHYVSKGGEFSCGSVGVCVPILTQIACY